MATKIILGRDIKRAVSLIGYKVTCSMVILQYKTKCSHDKYPSWQLELNSFGFGCVCICGIYIYTCIYLN